MDAQVKNAVLALADHFDVQPSTIVGIIQNESSWNPTIKNPNSSARGLIQFMDSTAKSLGFSGGSSELIAKYPDALSQLNGPVKRYYDQFAPYNNDEEFIIATFYPAWRKKSLDTVLPADVRKANPGITTIGDYVNRVKMRIASYEIVKTFR